MRRQIICCFLRFSTLPQQFCCAAAARTQALTDTGEGFKALFLACACHGKQLYLDLIDSFNHDDDDNDDDSARLTEGAKMSLLQFNKLRFGRSRFARGRGNKLSNPL